MSLRPKAFTLIELLVVISIISLLSSVVLASLNAAREKARLAAGRQFAAQADRVAGEQAVALWDFDECSGTSATDRSGGNTGTMTNGAAWSADVPSGSGCSAAFDGTNDYVSVATSFSPIVGTNPFTLSYWFKTDRIPSGGAYDTMVSKSYWSGTNDVGWKTNLYAPGDSRITFFGSSAAATCITLTGPAVSTGLWYQVVVTSDGSAGKLYLNGVQVASGAQTCGIDPASSYNLVIGGRSGPVHVFDGLIDSVHIFGKTLTASEIRGLYASEAAGKETALKD